MSIFSSRKGSGNFNIHATAADPYARKGPTTNLGAEPFFWKLFFNPPWVWFTAKGLLQPVTRQPAERTQTEKSIIDQQSNPLMCEKWLWQHQLPGQKFKMLKGSFSVKQHILVFGKAFSDLILYITMQYWMSIWRVFTTFLQVLNDINDILRLQISVQLLVLWNIINVTWMQCDLIT